MAARRPQSGARPLPLHILLLFAVGWLGLEASLALASGREPSMEPARLEHCEKELADAVCCREFRC